MSEAVKGKVKSSGNMLKIIIIFMLILLLIGGAGFGGYYIASKSAPKANTGNSVSEKDNTEEAFYEAGEFVVNLADEGSKRYLKVKLVLGYNSKNKKLTDELEKKNTVIADSIISTLRIKKTADLSTATGPEELKQELIARINATLSLGKISNVYYNDFFIQ
ncbi:flagellar basal body-associated FliL family protein [Clostridium thermarum]|uniref:flagellar basal body-associated FliL family protein n=1 Tax=Clostridium thermarum TaxID=1716543 RepID=UPI0013D223E5|nr:flagellar basal body-associated FliL family protein [Clostridium thermarum]